MNSQASVPPTRTVKSSKTHLGSNVQTSRYTAEGNGCIVEDIVLTDPREVSRVAFSEERLARMLERAR